MHKHRWVHEEKTGRSRREGVGGPNVRVLHTGLLLYLFVLLVHVHVVIAVLIFSVAVVGVVLDVLQGHADDAAEMRRDLARAPHHERLEALERRKTNTSQAVVKKLKRNKNTRKNEHVTGSGQKREEK